MIDLYYWPTPNGHKITIALEEMALAYNIKPINIGKGDQFAPDFLAFSPNNRMPAIIDNDSQSGGSEGGKQTVFESGAILLYLAEKTGRFIPDDKAGRIKVWEWLMWQMGGLGPMLGQAHHFNFYAPEKNVYAQDRYSREAQRLYGVLNRQLEQNEWVAGKQYSIADMACFPWTRTPERQGANIDDFPHVERWQQAMWARDAVARGMAIGTELREDLKKLSKKERNALFPGQK